MKLLRKLVLTGTIGTIATLITVLIIASLMTNIGIVFALGTPDALGNRIQNLTISQLNGGWAQVDAMYTYTNYTFPPGFDITCAANKNTRFNVTVYLNDTLATSAADAVTKTRVYVTISLNDYGVAPVAGWDERLMNDGNIQGDTGAGWYWIRYWEDWTTGGMPAAGTVYFVTIQYQAYY